MSLALAPFFMLVMQFCGNGSHHLMTMGEISLRTCKKFRGSWQSEGNSLGPTGCMGELIVTTDFLFCEIIKVY